MPLDVLDEEIQHIFKSLPTKVQDMYFIIGSFLGNNLRKVVSPLYRRKNNKYSREFISEKIVIKDDIIPVENLFVDAVITHDIAHVTSGDPNKIDNNARIPVLTYTGIINLFDKEGNIHQLPYELVILAKTGDALVRRFTHGQMQKRLSLGDASMDPVMFEINQRNPRGSKEKIQKYIIDNLCKYYNFIDIISEIGFWRGEKTISSFPSMNDIISYDKLVFDSVMQKNEMSSGYPFRGSLGKKYKKFLEKNGGYKEIYDKRKEALYTILKQEDVWEGKRNFIDMGALDGDKVLDFLNDMGFLVGRYIAVEGSSENQLLIANTRSNKRSSDSLEFQISGLQFEDFTALGWYKQKVIFDLGNTLGNHSVEEIKEKFDQYAKIMQQGDILIIEIQLYTEDIDVDSIVAGYNGQHNKERIVDVFQESGATTITPENVQAVRDQGERTVFTKVYVGQDDVFNVGENYGYIEKGRDITAIRSKFFLPEEMVGYAEDKFSVNNISDGNHGIFIFEKI